MNILPKKRWHVRNKDNVARVRRDEAKAKEEEEERERRHLFAEQEARTNILRSRARVQQVDKEVELEDYTGHINFFQDIEEGKVDTKVNTEHEAEKKADQEKQEKRIGLLTYLGQSVLDNKDKSWHNMSKTERQQMDEIRALRSEPWKTMLDPLNQMRKYVTETKKFQEQVDVGVGPSSQPQARVRGNIDVSFPMVTKAIERSRKSKRKHKSKKEKKKGKKHKHKRHSSQSDGKRDDTLEELASSSSEDDKEEDRIMKRKKLEVMRQQRLKREREERERAQKLVAEREGNKAVRETNKTTQDSQRYNSQFHPELARQTKHIQTQQSY